MNVAHVEIVGGDYFSSGRGSKKIKEELRKIGVLPETIRRAIVAVYEAEMNVAIHAYGGTLRATITPETLELVIEDNGPGIPDIEQAMQEGFSTAPPEAREQGFGAGMGLPNIRRNTDRFTIDSIVGKGTTLRFSVYLKPEAAERMRATAVTVEPERCIKCLQCLNVCPTQAIRVCKNGPEIIRHLCVDCTTCIETCPQGVFDMDCAADAPEGQESSILVLPDAILGQCGLHRPLESIEKALADAGWKNLLFSGIAEKAVAEAALAFREKKASATLLLVPVCPAVLNLIQLRYPSLLRYIVPLLTPIEILRDSLADAVFVPSCPAQSALVRDISTSDHVSRLHPKKIKKILYGGAKSNQAMTEAGDQKDLFPATVIAGIKRVCQFLDKAERGQMEDCGVVALYACDQGCFGSPFWDMPPALAQQRADILKPETAPVRVHALYRAKPLEPRSGARLAPDMSTAIKKLTEINRITKNLPGRNCGVCGAPTCLTLAEDVVMNRATLASCIFLENVPDTPETGKEDSF